MFFKTVFEECIELVTGPFDSESFDRFFSLTIQMTQKFLDLGMKKEASQLADCLSKRVDSFDFMVIAHQRPISRSKLFRYKLETLKLSANSSRIEVCLKRIYFRKMRNLPVQRLFRTFLDYEATTKNKGPNETHWSNADST